MSDCNQDGVSEIHSMQQEPDILIVRFFKDNPEDPLEGRREGVSLINSSNMQHSLEENCINAGAFVCVREQAGVHLLHSVVAFDSKAKKMIEVEHCRNPSWSGAYEIELALHNAASQVSAIFPTPLLVIVE